MKRKQVMEWCTFQMVKFNISILFVQVLVVFFVSLSPDQQNTLTLTVWQCLPTSDVAKNARFERKLTPKNTLSVLLGKK